MSGDGDLGGSADAPIRARDLALNAATSWLDRLVDALVFLFLIPVVLAAVGTDEYGLWTLVWAVVSILGLVDMGFGTSVVRYVADARGKGDSDRVRRTVCTLFWIFVAQSLAVAMLVAAATIWFGTVFDVPADHVDTGSVVMLVVGAGFTARVPLAMFRGVLVGHQRLWIANVYKIVATIGYLVAVPLVLSRWPDLKAFAVVNLLVSVVPSLAVALHVWITVPVVSLRPRYFDRSLLRELWGFSFYFMLIQVSVLVATRVDALIINAVLPLSAVAVYGIAMRVSEQAYGVCAQITRTLTPVVAQLHGAGDEDRLKIVWLSGSKITVAFATPLLVGCAILAEPLIVSWAGDEFAAAAPVLQLLLAANMVGIAHTNSHDQLGMRGQERFLSLASITGQAINFGLSVVFIHLWGIVGVAVATMSAPLLVDVILIQGRLSRTRSVPRWSFYRQTLVPSLIPAVTMAAVLIGWQGLHPIDGLVEVAGAEIVALIVFWGLFWSFGLTTAERAWLGNRLKKRITKS